MTNLIQYFFVALFILFASCNSTIFAEEKKFEQPIVRVVDLDIGEEQVVTLHDGTKVCVKLLKLQETHDSIRGAVRKAVVDLEIDGKPISLKSGKYNLPQKIGNVQVDCSVTSGLNKNGTAAFWGLDKAARIRLWPANSALLKPDSFIYPVKQRWFVTKTWFDNEVVDSLPKIVPEIYYHSGLDIGGTEHLSEVVAATDAVVISSGLEVLGGHVTGTYATGSPVAKRGDVVYLQDARGWYYRYSHLAEIDKNIIPGRRIPKGTRIGVIGKEGASGGWSHLHFEIKCKQPSGKWGTQAGYAFLREAYLSQYHPMILANARSKSFIRTGEIAALNGSYSWSKNGKIKSYEWLLEDGSTSADAITKHRYSKPGVYHELLKVTDEAGNIDYDFSSVIVLDPKHPDTYPPSLHATYSPSLGIKTGDEITFKVRGFNYTKQDKSAEVWDFGDDSKRVEVHSMGGHIDQHAKNGYAVTKHRYSKPGHYLVTVRRKSIDGLPAIFRLQVRVE